MAFRRAAAALLALALGVGAARAESPEPPDPVYRALRYDDDFSHPEPKSAHDFFAPIKYIPFGDGPLGKSYMTLGGEARERYENYGNINFGFNNAPPASHYVLQRLQLNADVHVTDYFRAFGQIGYWDRFGVRGVPSTTDIDRGDVMQAFVDFRGKGPWRDQPTFRVGREELLFGWQRLIAVREGPNVRRAFDGFRFIDKIGETSINLLAVRPVANFQGTFDDVTNQAQWLSGVYVTTPVPFVPKLKTDLYVLGYERENARYRGLTGTEKRQTIGTRLFGESNGYDWNVEAIAQSGTFRNLDIRAFWLAGVAGYKFENAPWTPRISLQGNYASGDERGATLGTFNAMYPRLPYFAETSMLVPANVRDIRPVLTFNPVNNVQVVLGYDMLWRASTVDGLYGSGMTLYPGTSSPKVTGASIGQESSIDVRWRVDQHLSLGAIAAYLNAGPAVTEAGGKSVTFGVLFAKYKF